MRGREFIAGSGHVVARSERVGNGNAGDRDMRTEVIDQSVSEARLHRVLYFVMYLRAMVLNLFLVFIATILFFGTGIEGVYFLADSTIDALKAQMDQLRRQGDVLTYFVPLVTGRFTGLALLAFFVWTYLSITKVRRVALKLQAAFLIGLKAAALLHSGAKRLGGLSVSDVVRNPNDRFVLYLRPFGADDVVLPKPRLPFWSRLLSLRPFPARIEEEFFDVTDGYRPLIAIGSPSKSGEELGGMAYRAYVDNAHWQDYVLEKIERAESIVIVLRDTEGVRWELAQIINRGAAQKTLFLFDPSAKDPDAWQALAALILPPFHAAGLVARDFAFQGRPIGFYFDTGQLIEIENVHWTTTSYRTAFSHFLASRAGCSATERGLRAANHAR